MAGQKEAPPQLYTWILPQNGAKDGGTNSQIIECCISFDHTMFSATSPLGLTVHPHPSSCGAIHIPRSRARIADSRAPG